MILRLSGSCVVNLFLWLFVSGGCFAVLPDNLPAIKPAIDCSSRTEGVPRYQPPETKADSGMANWVYDDISKATSAIDTSDWVTAFDELDRLRRKLPKLRPHEAATMWTLYNFLYFRQGNYFEAEKIDKKELALAGITRQEYDAGYFSLVEAYTLQDDFCRAWAGFKSRSDRLPSLTVAQLELGSQILLQLRDYRTSYDYLSRLFKKLKQEGRSATERDLHVKLMLEYTLGRYDDAIATALTQSKRYNSMNVLYFAAYLYQEKLHKPEQAVKLLGPAFATGELTRDSHIMGFATMAYDAGHRALSCKLFGRVSDPKAFKEQKVEAIEKFCHSTIR